MPAKVVKKTSPQPTAVYARTGKGVLAFKNRTAKLPPQLKDLFSCIDGKASVADLRDQAKMAAAELEQALDTLEEKGYIKVFKGGDEVCPDFTEAPDLDFTSPGSLLEMSVREAANAKANAEANAEERTDDEAVQLPEEPVQAPRDTTTAAADEQTTTEDQRRAHAETVAQSEASEARIQDLEAALGRAEEASAQMQLQIGTERSARESAEAEAHALRRARNEAVKALAQAKSSAAEERMRAEEQAQKLAEAEARHPGPAVQTGSMQEALAQAQETVAHLELQLATESETREQTVQALREAQSGAEAGRNAAEMRLKEVQIALQQAEKVDRQNRERLRQLEAQIETGRRARSEAEAALEAERRTREETAQALRDLQSVADEARTRADVRLQMLAEAATEREAIQAELAEAKLECERAIAAASQHAERTAQVELEIDTERRARTEAEAKASADRESREKATQAMLEIKKVIGLWKDD